MMPAMTRARGIFISLTVVLALTAPLAAAARPAPVKPPLQVKVGGTAVVPSPYGLPQLLVRVRYPVQLAGRLVETRIELYGPGGETARPLVLHERLNGGVIRRPDRRRGFTFVHRVGLNETQARLVREEPRVRILARGNLDVDEDGRAELGSSDSALRQPTFEPRPKPFCSSIPHLRVRPGKRISVPLPLCDTAMKWTVSGDRARGFARVRHGRLIYRAPKRFRGRDAVLLSGKRLRRRASASAVGFISGPVQVTVGTASGVVVRALGDSVTAGFGYFSNGEEMSFGDLLECRPAAKEFDDACSSNSLNTSSKETKVEYAADYGLANNVSWAAQWANSHGVTNYKNFAVSGSEPKNWAPGGELHKTTAQIAGEDPDYILMTMGANPLLSEMLFGVDNMGCAIYSDVFGGYQQCVEEAFAEVGLQKYLRSLYSDLVKNTEATIYLIQYHLSVPSTALAYSATQIAAMGQLLNREIATIAAEVNPQRLRVVAPPHFDVGIDISPVYPSRYSCSLLDFKVDGPSVQSDPTQDELEILHPLSFCEGPENGEQPWVISGDTGIHPSATGYAQMASQVPAPN